MNSVGDSETSVGEQAPLRKINPSPRRGHIIAMTLEDAPGVFASIEGVAQYTVENATECGEKVALSGAFPRISTSEPFVLTKVSENEYRGTVYEDLIVDEDYFGRGVCRWKFSSVSVHLSATTDGADTKFIPSIDSILVASSGSEAKYFWKARYPRVADYDGFPVFGESDLESVPEDKRGEFFVITLASGETSR
ncbi:hypothetical protein SAMN05428982_0840 [Pseudoxanthomonas sp. CF385]|uniref:hypothetical protein n=1 Tax=Pseudoxanthomonas sp. CF385 TaxID=1881042 RepID=UPI0008911763|nr:hypothetical protein [Pseudoxanthomonas sp. CF385]SDQ36655.1 hypothetical protein SAMN05428982_0840 [Pseudoxanthomonas sp. CF385]